MTESTFNEQLLTPINFDDFANLLAPLGILNSPSELHGLLCGKLAGGASLSEVNWLLEAVEFLDFVSAPDESVRLALSRLYHSTQDQLRSAFGLKLMLPDDASLLSERARALSEWCHGFLSGFGSVDHQGKRNISEEYAEILQDIANIVQIQVDDEEDEPSAEADYMEVTEYVRVAVSNLYDEFAPEPLAAPTTPSASDTLH
jgi:yecA family protein